METRSERLKERYRQQYREADRAVKRITSADNGAYMYMEDLANQQKRSPTGENKYRYTKSPSSSAASTAEP